MVFVGGWYSTGLLKRSARDEFEAARAHIAMTQGADAEVVVVAETSNAIHGDRTRPLSQRPRLGKSELPAFGAKMTDWPSGSRGGAQTPPPSPYGHDRPGAGTRH